MPNFKLLICKVTTQSWEEMLTMDSQALLQGGHPHSLKTMPFCKPGKPAAGQAYLAYCTQSTCIPFPRNLELITKEHPAHNRLRDEAAWLAILNI